MGMLPPVSVHSVSGLPFSSRQLAETAFCVYLPLGIFMYRPKIFISTLQRLPARSYLEKVQLQQKRYCPAGGAGVVSTLDLVTGIQAGCCTKGLENIVS
jgi:hypothetical protein